MTDDELELDVHALLEQRAAQLARKVDDGIDREVVYEVAVVQVAGETFGIAADALREIVIKPPVAELPGVSSPLCGIVHVRGELMSVIGTADLLNLQGECDEQQLAVLDGPEGPVGLLIDHVIGVRRVHADELAPSFANQDARTHAVKAMTNDFVAILDTATLLGDPRLIVNHA
ncbi:MAG: chemotaxis protein CheW [Gammaproteobacteria bacterium]